MVFGLFSKEKSLAKTIERATNKLAQQPDRWASLEKLKEDGSDAALFGLCRRFGVTSQKAVEDEQEKRWVVDTLVAAGPTSLPPLVRYMKASDHLSFPLRAVERIGDKEKVLEIADELFATETPGYVRMPDRRIDLIRWFREWKPGSDAEIVQRLTPYVTDFDENSRSAAIEGMARRDPALIGAPLIAALLRPDEESGRIKRQILEVLAAGKVPLGEQAAAVGAALRGPLSDDFRVDGDLVKKR